MIINLHALFYYHDSQTLVPAVERRLCFFALGVKASLIALWTVRYFSLYCSIYTQYFHKLSRLIQASTPSDELKRSRLLNSKIFWIFVMSRIITKFTIQIHIISIRCSEVLSFKCNINVFIEPDAC